jgi:hypothetical protein
MIANLAFRAHRVERLAGTLALPYPIRNQPQSYLPWNDCGIRIRERIQSSRATFQLEKCPSIANAPTSSIGGLRAVILKRTACINRGYPWLKELNPTENVEDPDGFFHVLSGKVVLLIKKAYC